MEYHWHIYTHISYFIICTFCFIIILFRSLQGPSKQNYLTNISNLRIWIGVGENNGDENEPVDAEEQKVDSQRTDTRSEGGKSSDKSGDQKSIADEKSPDSESRKTDGQSEEKEEEG